MEPEKTDLWFGLGETETQAENTWRILEFYSGIGAMRYSLMRAGILGRVVEAFDINNIANDVYEHNFGHRPFQGNIQVLTPADLDKYEANVWLLSPPCQPYTRQGLQKDSTDARAFSFIKILENMPYMKQPPLMLFVENVVGFETSNTHKHMIEVLSTIGFVTQEFILSPLQFGIPYSRPRYFCLAKREPLHFRNPSFNNLILSTPSLFMSSKDTKLTNGAEDIDANHIELDTVCEPITKFLEVPCIIKSQEGYTRLVASSMADGKSDTDQISNSISHPKYFQNSNVDNVDKYSVPPSLIERWGNAMDIVFPESKRCCCFTKSYYRYVKGTGSLLATSGCINSRTEPLSLKDLGLRFFTPREVANLHSFPVDFHFPPDVSLRQQYALLGNSMSVAVVSPLFQYLFSEPT